MTIAMKALVSFSAKGVKHQDKDTDFMVTSKSIADRLETDGVAKRVLAEKSKIDKADATDAAG